MGLGVAYWRAVIRSAKLEWSEGFPVTRNGAGWSEGDWNTDGLFDSGDMVQVYAAGKYEQGWTARWSDSIDAGAFIGEEAGWSEGDWNGDGVFNSSDMVTAFVDGGYEKGLRTDAVAVPEPTSVLLLTTSLMAVAVCRRRLRNASEISVALRTKSPGGRSSC